VPKSAQNFKSRCKSKDLLGISKEKQRKNVGRDEKTMSDAEVGNAHRLFLISESLVTQIFFI
jgi:hypothetical protein